MFAQRILKVEHRAQYESLFSKLKHLMAKKKKAKKAAKKSSKKRK